MKYNKTMIVIGGLVTLFGLKVGGVGKLTSYGKGITQGQVHKVEQNGLFWKSWEITISHDGVFSFYSVKDDQQIVDTFIYAMNNNDTVTIHYGQPYIMPIMDGSSGNYVISVYRNSID